MGLSNELVSLFVKATKDEPKTETSKNYTGTIVIDSGLTYVQLDGSEYLTPVSSTVDVVDGEKVTVTIENHKAVVNGNTSSPAARTDDVQESATKITELEIVVADKVSTEQLEVTKGQIDDLVTDNVLIKEQLVANEAKIEKIETEDLVAVKGDIDQLEANKLDASVADITYATIKDLEATDADIYNLNTTYLEFVAATGTELEAIHATIEDLDAHKLTVDSLRGEFANIDFSNIGEAAIGHLFSESGIIEGLVMSEGHVTGRLVGVTIVGDLIEGGTVKADKLVIQGEDGLYYKLNTTGESVTAEQTEYNSLDGKIITAQSITAEKINVDDLVAFDATIGGFQITENALHSGVKSSVDNTTRGVYLDNTGQVAFGDETNYLKYYKDGSVWKLEISAASIKMGGVNKTLEEELTEIRDEVTCNLRIESSRGTVFKNDNISTVLSAVIYRGSERITDITTLRAAMGSGAYLQWKWQRLDEETFGVISASDTRLGNNGFTFTLSPEDVDTKVTFMCELIV